MIEYFYIVTVQRPSGNLDTYTGTIELPTEHTAQDLHTAIAAQHYGLPGGIIHYHTEPN